MTLDRILLEPEINTEMFVNITNWAEKVLGDRDAAIQVLFKDIDPENYSVFCFKNMIYRLKI